MAPLKILLVENHAVFADTVRKHFLAEHEVTTVPTLAGARAVLCDVAPDLVLVDYDLDDGKGDELVRERRRGGSAIPIIGTSSHRAGNHALLAAGANAVCSKMDFGGVQEVIQRIARLG